VASPELRSPLQGYVVALEILERSKAAGDNAAQTAAAATPVDVLVERLRTMGVSRRQLDEVARTRVIPQAIRIDAPAAGFVLARSVTTGQTIDRGHELYRIADLGRVWILADVFGRDFLLFDVAGVVAACAMVTTLVVTTATHVRALYAAEPLP